MTNVGSRIRELRERRAYSQAELARAVNITPSTLSAIEKGKRSARPATLRKIAGFFNIDVEALTVGREDRP